MRELQKITSVREQLQPCTFLQLQFLACCPNILSFLVLRIYNITFSGSLHVTHHIIYLFIYIYLILPTFSVSLQLQATVYVNYNTNHTVLTIPSV